MPLLEIKINGRDHQLVIDATASLLTVLREHLPQSRLRNRRLRRLFSTCGRQASARLPHQCP
jgi:aerobic-type carbon monoxide dehydrogenase small subunit (CoxS/CutS family)